jgi:hypothetical protein
MPLQTKCIASHIHGLLIMNTSVLTGFRSSGKKMDTKSCEDSEFSIEANIIYIYDT